MSTPRLPPAAGDGLAGMVLVRPGQPMPGTVVMQRPALAARVAPGVPVAQLPALMGQIHNLCAMAHERCAALALRAAGAAVDLPSRDLDEMAAVDHVRRIVLDWPRELLAHDPVSRDAVGAVAMRCLREGPWLARERAAMAPEARRAAMRGWLDRLLGMPSRAWLQAWEAGEHDWLRDWCRAQVGWLPTLLRAARLADTPDCVDGATLLDLHEDPTRLHALALALRDGFGAQPAGRPMAGARPEASAHGPLDMLALRRIPHTGCWSRQRDDARARRALGACGMLGARVAELARLVNLPPRGEWLSQGAQAIGRGHALAWVETARGVLIHRVELDPSGSGEPRARAFQVIAPTDWNFHRAGAVAHALARQQARGEAAARVVLCAFDACVPCRIDSAPAVNDPAREAADA